MEVPIADVLAELQLSRHLPQFTKEGVDTDLLAQLVSQDHAHRDRVLKEELGVAKLGERLALIAYVEQQQGTAHSTALVERPKSLAGRRTSQLPSDVGGASAWLKSENAKLVLGPAADTDLFRGGVGHLKTGGAFSAGGAVDALGTLRSWEATGDTTGRGVQLDAAARALTFTSTQANQVFTLHNAAAADPNSGGGRSVLAFKVADEVALVLSSEHGMAGVGTEEPTAKLDVRGRIASQLTASEEDGGGVARGISIDGSARQISFTGPAGSEFVLANNAAADAANSIKINFHDQTKLTILSNGNVGIGLGNGNPQALLHLKGDNQGLRIEDGSAAVYYDVHRHDATGLLRFTGSQGAPHSGYEFFVDGGATNALTITHAGAVGIGGAAEPSEKLEVNGKVKADEFCTADGKCTATLGGRAPRPYEPDAYTALLLHMDGSDGSTSFPAAVIAEGRSVTAHGGAQVKTQESVFGGASAHFNCGSPVAKLTIPDSNTFQLDADFTIEPVHESAEHFFMHCSSPLKHRSHTCTRSARIALPFSP